MCVAGWTGTNCDQNINECVINPCKNGAACVDGINAYTCNCVAKWGGINCDQNINECSPNPCQNGATCIDGINAYTCNCVAGWSGKNCDQNKRTDTTSTTKSQPISNDAHTDRIDTSVLTPRASNDGFQNVIIAVACVVSAVIIAIAVVIAVVCVKRKRRSMANVPLPDAPREDQVAEEKGYASIGDSECQYAVVNKPKKQSTLKVKQDPPVENKPMEMQSNPEKPSGAGELIYADLDKEALKAKPSNSKPAGTLEKPRTPTEYVGIDFARTVALQDANKLEE
ncbi:neurogenic locus protein delta-like [Dreissena polymorpha]|uniref:EGF-like domain-containing protein n=1 Tax=Dreissena polymorpha TaxID=45954 RepID=A0A9D4BR35_DREPO|nr:neurogenic locus protein delta-like [Dreissena polymorpha]KAH3704478.1 hypothetical protein DPMN_079534 [Dreissena polymorpha]